MRWIKMSNSIELNSRGRKRVRDREAEILLTEKNCIYQKVMQEAGGKKSCIVNEFMLDSEPL